MKWWERLIGRRTYRVPVMDDPVAWLNNPPPTSLPEPTPPTGAWLEYGDGTRYTDLPVIFMGIGEDGCAQFEVIPPRDEPPVSFGCATLPGMTAIGLPALRPRTWQEEAWRLFEGDDEAPRE